MRGGQIIREARRRAGLTQAELAAKLGTTQSAVARLERGRTEPSYSRVTEAVRACGLSLIPRITELDDSDWSIASTNLLLDHRERVQRHQAAVRFVEAGRIALNDARR
jgi:transcriptional regulator with XRE-family HTH domain